MAVVDLAPQPEGAALLIKAYVAVSYAVLGDAEWKTTESCWFIAREGYDGPGIPQWAMWELEKPRIPARFTRDSCRMS